MDKIQKLVWNWLCKKNQEQVENPREYQNYKDLAETCRYSLIEDYTPDCPGWCGNILTVVFGHIGAVYTFTVEERNDRKFLNWVYPEELELDEDLEREKDASENNPFGDTVERHDIESEKELVSKLERESA